MYNDPSEGGEEEEQGGWEGNPPMWKMELKSPTANSLGVAPSQIMDTGQEDSADCLRSLVMQLSLL